MNFNLIRKSALIVTVAATTLFTACKKDDPVIEGPKSIAALVTANSNFSLLKAALIRANLVSTLDGTGTFTVFAPNNDAFVAAGLDTEAKINNTPIATLDQILRYHVLGSTVTAGQISASNNTAIKSISDVNLFVTKNTTGVFINGASVVQADVLASNGVIHVINTVLMPPSGNIVATAQADANFTYLVAAVLRASEGSTNVAAVLSGAGPLTVFAPTNQAFINAGYPTIASIQAASPATLTSILTYHVLSGRVLSSDLSEGLQPTTVNGEKLTITLSGGAKVKGKTNTTASSITKANFVTTNGVIHVIDQVLLP